MKNISTQQLKLRPELNPNLDYELFKSFYWLKQELIKFCRTNKLLTTGSKIELTTRIYLFLKTGEKEISLTKSTRKTLDSANDLTLDTPVINYKNNLKTRQFFTKHIGSHFHFNSYLRKFTNEKPINGLTYGDLIHGWIAEEDRKKSPNYTNTIDKQFQYNQFIHDFFIHEHNKTLQEAIKAWNAVKAVSGECTYEHYRQVIKET